MAAVLVLTSVPELSVYAAFGGESNEEVSGGEFTEDVLDNDYLATPDLVINTCDDLRTFSANVSSGTTYEGKLIRLGADIAFDGVTLDNFPAIGLGNISDGFSGTFDGAGHTISGIVQVGAVGKIGLFRQVNEKGVVKNLTLKNCNFQAASDSGSFGMVGYNYGSIRNCVVENSAFKSNDSVTWDYTGAIAGQNYGTIDSCKNVATEIYAKSCGGGIAGYSGGSIMNCWSSGKVTVFSQYSRYRDYSDVGGIAGTTGKYNSSNATIVNCGNTGNVSNTNNHQYVDKCVGGIVGFAEYTTIQNSYNAGAVSATGNAYVYVGGLIGHVATGCMLGNSYYSLDRNDVAYGYTKVKPTELNVSAQTDSYMQSAGFTALLSNNRAANATWLPWTVANGSAYPQHVPVYMIDVASVSYGTVSCSYDSTYAGNSVTFSVTPATYYRVTGVSVTASGGQNVAVAASGNNFTFAMPASNVTISVSFAFSMPIADCRASLSAYSYTYDGKDKTPSVTVQNGATTLRKGRDYNVSYASNKNAGTGVVTITGLGSYTGTKTLTFTIYKADQVISGGASSYEKTVGAKAFSLNTKLKVGQGKLAYKSSNKKIAAVSSTGKVTIKAPGCAKITISAKGSMNYNAAVKTCNIIVKPKKPTLTGVKSLKGKQLQATWQKDSTVTGYMIEYATGSTFRNSRKVYITGGKKTSGIIKGLTATKKYYVRVYSFKTATVDGYKKNIYSVPSNVILSNKVKR